jgi:hypothetical protein
MNDPTRLYEDETNSLDAVLLRAGRDYSPSSTRLGRIAAGIAGAGATIGSHAAAAASVGASGAGLGTGLSGTALVTVVKWVGIGALAGLTVSATAAVVETQGPAARDAASEQENTVVEALPVPIEDEARAHSSTPQQPSSESMPEDQRAAAGARSQAPATAPAAAGRPSASRTPLSRAASLSQNPAVSPKAAGGTVVADPLPAASSAADSTAVTAALREEVAALGLAKAALDRGAAQEVLAHVSAYRVRFPRGRLGPEATYLEMEAELLRGNRGRARKLAGELTGVASPNATRVREVAEGGVP